MTAWRYADCPAYWRRRSGSTQHDDAYAAIYKAASLGSTNSVSAKVVTQADTNSWAKSGVAIRASLAQPGSAGGYAVVVVTPSNGVGFEWDSNGDGYIDSSTVASIATNQAIWVKLTRNGGQVSAFYSLDGTTYAQIGTAQTLTGTTTQEDAGIISTSHDASSLAANTHSAPWQSDNALRFRWPA
ncbi:hypothetical protein [Mesorhizobium japonicum]|uniref:hypothetical protein n=1 Tax=Mesorhizobium japonicum TaxID=2066070 RepID=UPI003B5AA0B2